MYLIKLNAIDSTNNYLKAMSVELWPKDYTVVIAKHQTNGKGQMGAVWGTQASKNLTASVFKEFERLAVESQFYISMIVSLTICKALHIFKIPKLQVKWPNDILSADKKVCGILIENIIKEGQIKGSIIGIGLNINQTNFDNLPRASSMKLVSQRNFDVEEVLVTIVSELKLYFKWLETKQFSKIQSAYENVLFRINKPSTFKTEEGLTFIGIIKGVTNYGKLKILIEDGVIKTYNIKEISMLY